MLDLLIKGLIIGFCIAAPVGPIGILCINRSLHDGFKAGLIAGCGAATADGCYGLIAGFGLTFISSFFIREQMWIRLIGGLFLLYLGAKTFFGKPAEKSATISQGKNYMRAYLSTFLLTATNPMTILSFIAVFAGLGLGSVHVSYWASSLLVLGVILGSLIWWVLLTFTVSKLFHHRINALWLQRINQLSGSVLIIFGVIALFSIFIK